MLCARLVLGRDQLPGNQQGLQEMTGPNQEIVRWIKQMRYDVDQPTGIAIPRAMLLAWVKSTKSGESH